LEAAHKGKTLWALSKFLRELSFKTDKGHGEQNHRGLCRCVIKS
jgi:hypothetical protein